MLVRNKGQGRRKTVEDSLGCFWEIRNKEKSCCLKREKIHNDRVSCSPGFRKGPYIQSKGCTDLNLS